MLNEKKINRKLQAYQNSDKADKNSGEKRKRNREREKQVCVDLDQKLKPNRMFKLEKCSSSSSFFAKLKLNQFIIQTTARVNKKGDKIDSSRN